MTKPKKLRFCKRCGYSFLDSKNGRVAKYCVECRAIVKRQVPGRDENFAMATSTIFPRCGAAK